MLNPTRMSLKRARVVFPHAQLLCARRFAAVSSLKSSRPFGETIQVPSFQSFQRFTAGLALPKQSSQSNSNNTNDSNPLSEVSLPQVSDTQRELDKHNRPEFLTEYYLPFQFRRQEKISRYSLSSVIGQGFFATVYKAVDKEGGRREPVAIKSISKTKCPLEIVTRELEIMRSIQPFATGTNCLGEIRDVFETQTTVNFVLALCEGGDLFDFVSTKGKLSETQAKQVLKCLLTALDCLHSHDIIHRDIKLENTLLKRKNDLTSCQLLDFGYAKHMKDKDVFKNPAGTYGYVAPEVLSNRLYTPACDIWSAGIVLYTVLSGQQPFPYNSKEQEPVLNTTSMQSSVLSEDGFIQTTRRKKSLMSIELEAITHGRSEENWNKELKREPFSFVSVEGKDILSSLLNLDPKKRPSAKEALQHNWFKL